MADIHDVAKLAGVSIKTVSRVVNREPGVRDATRERVQQAVDKLQYKPHSGARLMRSGRSGLIGLVTSTISTVSRDPAKAGLSSIHIVKGIQQICREAKKTLLIIDTEPDAEDVQDSVDILLSHRVEGIFHVLDYHRLIAPLQVVDTPYWLVNGYSTAQTPAVVPDDFTGQMLAVEYLIEQGHSRIAYVGLATELEAGRLRHEGFLQAMRQHGFANGQVLTEQGMASFNDNSFSRLPEALGRLLSQPVAPTAICFGNDLMALQAIVLLEKRGLRIPEDLSIMGYDNDVATASAARPKITTVALPYQRMGRVAAQQLMQQLQSPESNTTTSNYPIKVKGEVVPRESVRLLATDKS